nr:FAD-binding oxidoreductase [Pseudomonadota bacterium]
MDLKSGYPYWAIKNGLMHAFPQLRADLSCDVVVIGGGITGALIADELAIHGHDVVVLDQRDAGWGSTSASTALLQYEIDTPMVDLAEMFGEQDAALAYRACAEAIDLIADKARDVGDVAFSRMKSLYYASNKRHRKDLRREFELREQHGFDMQWLDSGEVRDAYGFDAPCAILSRKAARVDPYRLAYRLLARLQRNGARVHDRSPVARILANADGVELHTTQGAVVRGKYLVMAAGYESQKFLDQRVAKNRSSYAFITDPIETELLGPLVNTLVWESARPYLYMRTTSDNRLLIGGEDDSIDIPAKRDALVER